MKLSVIIPVYNEINTIDEILSRVFQVDLIKEVIVIDDFSTDGTREVLKQLERELPKDPRNEMHILFQDKNLGKGAALRSGIRKASGDILIIQDADLEYDPMEYPRLIQPILDGDADVVYGSRFLGSPRRVLLFWHTLGNRCLTFLSNLCTNLNLTDMETGYKVFKREVLDNIQLKSNRFGFEPEVTAKIAKLNHRIYEVPISYNGRDYWEGKKINWVDGVKAISAILKYNFFESGTQDTVYHTLLEMRKLHRYNQWVFSMVRPFLGKRVLEIGSGIGNITRFLLDRDFIAATDIEPRFLSILKSTFGKFKKYVISDFNIESSAIATLRTYHFDSIICFNVLEHVQNEERALKNAFDLLEPGGRLFLLVPSHPSLYGSLDLNLGHHRRYGRKILKEKLEEMGFHVTLLRYVNRLGVLGWFLNSRILRRKRLSAFQLKLFDVLVPILKVEKLVPLPFGISLLAIAEKPEQTRRSPSENPVSVTARIKEAQ